MTANVLNPSSFGVHKDFSRRVWFVLLTSLLVSSCILDATSVRAASLLAFSRAVIPPQEIVDLEQPYGTPVIAKTDAMLEASDTSAKAQTESRFGSNSAYARVRTLTSESSRGFAAANSKWTDVFTITVPTVPPHAVLSATIGVELNGTFNASAFGTAIVDFELQYDLEGLTPFGASVAAYSKELSAEELFLEVDELISLTFQFENSVPFTLAGSLATVVIIEAGVFADIEANFSETAMVTFIDIPPGASLVAESGQVYPLGIPEPSTFVLVCTLVLLTYRRPRRPF